MHSNVLYVYMEYVPGGSIESLIEKFGAFPEDLTKVYARQILCGLKYLHDANIMHRDIKGANVLVSNDGQVKVSDFGASKEIEELTQGDEGMRGTLTGTPLWMAPEVVLEKGYGKASDVFSFGATVMEMLTGKPPNAHLKNFAALVRHWDREQPVAIPSTLSPVAVDFLERCLRIDPAARPTVDELLEHPFVSDVLAGTGATDITEPVARHYKATTVAGATAASMEGAGGELSAPSVMFASDPIGAAVLARADGGMSQTMGAPSGAAAAGGSDGPHIASLGLASFRVLVADSSTRDAALTASLLEDLGCAVTVVQTPEQATRAVGEAAAGAVHQLVIVDESFPAIGDVAFVHTISGLGLALTVRVNPAFAKAKLLFTTNGPAASFQIPAMLVELLGADLVLCKPLTSEKLFNAVRDAAAAL